MISSRQSVEIYVEDDHVLAEHSDLLTDRQARMFFGSILGAEETERGWRCPKRRGSLGSLVVRINTFLEAKGWTVSRAGIADESVQRDIERKRSYQRTKEKATAFRKGEAKPDLTPIRSALRKFGWDSGTRNLLEHQERGVAHGLVAINAANFSVPGSGKTATTLAIAAIHLANDTIDVVVVIGSLSCFAPWEQEVRTALPKQISAKRIRGNANRRHGAYSRVERGDLLLMSYATAVSDQSYLLELFRAQRVMLVIDESHRIKRFRGGVWAPALIEIAKHARVRFILSGTPMPQSGRDLYSQLNILWPGRELTGPRDGFAVRVDRNFPSVLRDVEPFISRTPKSALGLSDYEVVHHEVPLLGTQAEIYDLIEREE